MSLRAGDPGGQHLPLALHHNLLVLRQVDAHHAAQLTHGVAGVDQLGVGEASVPGHEDGEHVDPNLGGGHGPHLILHAGVVLGDGHLESVVAAYLSNEGHQTRVTLTPGSELVTVVTRPGHWSLESMNTFPHQSSTHTRPESEQSNSLNCIKNCQTLQKTAQPRQPSSVCLILSQYPIPGH